MEKHNFRTLAPAATQHSPPRKPDLNLKRKRTSVACDACRQKRAGCDGVRPACTACQKRQSQCTYMNQEDQEMRPTILKRENTTLREKIAAYGEIICLLENIPQTTVQDILRRLRTGSDPAVILRSLKSENFATTPSAQRMARSILPPIQSNCEFELLIRHPSAFPLVDLSQHAQATGNTLVRPRRSSTPQATLSHSPSSTLLPHDPPSSDQATGLFALGDLGASKRSRNSAEPKPPQYFDPRLAHLKIDFWTTVPISNEQAAGAISLYLEAQHHVWGAFDAGLFVRDLIEFRLDFCSPFMVSSLLAMACLYDAPLDPKGSKNSYAFEKEAVKLFQSEDNVDSLPTIAGLVLLYVSLAVHGEGMRGMQFLTAALQAAERMKLFGVPEVHEELSSASPETLVATSATAWGLFNMIIHAVRFYLMSPIVYPPKLPMPAELSIYRVPRQDATRESIALREKLVEMDKVLSNFAKIWTVLNQVYLIYRGQEGSGGSLAFALSKYSRILQLANELPQTMDRSRRTTNHVLIFQ
ncbi:uncharacterized protein K460DRAFT_98178 [Cucurbitaria berberidis CBS 394.84]|uniref:Zn(2)-C6 fungal-type domain-containing protein n=1 Tax=Cucurbitaria berberidis CBS 394.84 TaxID=1168544 RepID=A0A9P4L816_9PLEO|nr:uncharacterized protein K460DRAFT_98178 [Cucurbitaria berberidis CBS 394.84]KAF1844763.1 hypothetical protein K460DRAFT_98178 [Cucurbitaria berberidis CBS 394.84]